MGNSADGSSNLARFAKKKKERKRIVCDQNLTSSKKITLIKRLIKSKGLPWWSSAQESVF